MQKVRSDTGASFDVRNYFKRWPRFYYFVMIVFGPALFLGLSPKKFLERYPSGGKTLNLGSGPRIVAPGVVNVDIHSYRNVDLIADVRTIPLPDGSIARIISDNVLEHVEDPKSAVAEMHRLLEPGGLAYVAIPFVYPFHSSPGDYQRWSKQGLIHLFAAFDVVEIGVRAGPFSALTAYLCHLAGILFSFGSERANSLLTNLAMFVFFPLKYFDLVFHFWPHAHMLAAVLYCVIRKK